MPNNKIRPLPFLLIVGFSLVVMLAVLIAQYRSQNGIRQLRNGNSQALITFKIDNWLDEIVNETYLLDEQANQFLATSKLENFKNLQQAIRRLDEETRAIEALSIANDSTKNMIASLNSLLQKKTAPYRLLRLPSSDTVRRKFQAAINTDAVRQLTDSIYVAALQIQIALGKNLENTIVKNEELSTSVLSFSWLMGFISIAAIAILASIIIRRLLQNFKLIKELEKAKIQAEKVSDIKEQFLANMSHEIRTPVNSVLGFTRLLEKTEMKEQQSQFVSMIKTAGQNLLNIINDILDLSKIESGMLQFIKKPFNLRELCRDVEMMFYHQLSEKGLSFTCVIEDNVPEIIVGDKERLNQVLMNLVNNAIKFTEAGEVLLQVTILKNDGKKVKLSFLVKDTGIGIQQDKLETIFERFEQAEASTTRKYGGTGLGLSIVKNLVNMQGGTISASSEYGHGAAFVFDLEFELTGSMQHAVVNKEASPKIQMLTFELPATLKLLVAEDNKMNQQLLQFIFESWGVQYVLAENGNECIQKLQQGKYDLILMDIQMPEIDGYQATQHIRQVLKNMIPIIAMTANVLPGEKEKCQKMGMNDYLPKPINEPLLYQAIVKNLPASIPANTSLIDVAYLQETFSGNQRFIKNIMDEFNIQYPKELAALQQAVAEKSALLVRSRSHHLKTTLSTVNIHSPLLAHLESLETTADADADWQMIQDKLKLLQQELYTSSPKAII